MAKIKRKPKSQYQQLADHLASSKPPKLPYSEHELAQRARHSRNRKMFSEKHYPPEIPEGERRKIRRIRFLRPFYYANKPSMDHPWDEETITWLPGMTYRDRELAELFVEQQNKKGWGKYVLIDLNKSDLRA